MYGPEGNSYVNDIADPSSLQDAYHAWTSEWALPTTVSVAQL